MPRLSLVRTRCGHHLAPKGDADQPRGAGVCQQRPGDNVNFHKHMVTWRMVPGSERGAVAWPTRVGPKYIYISILLARP